MKNEFEVIANVIKENKELIYSLIGQAYVTGKRVAIPKALYDKLTKEERTALRYILDDAQVA